MNKTTFFILCVSVSALSYAEARTGGATANATARLSAHGNAAPDQTVPGVVLVKLTADGAAQLATHNDLFDMIAPQRAVYHFYNAVQTFPAHSIMRYAGNGAARRFAHPSPDDGLARILFLRYPSGAPPAIVAQALAKNPFVEYAEPQYIRKECFVPNDSLFSKQWNLAKIHAPQAWDITQGDTNVVIAVVDNGVDHHPDLDANRWHNPGEEGLDAQGRDKRFNGIDDDGDGYVDDWEGWDFAGATQGAPQDNDPSGGDHGIHVAGIAAAVTNNHIGVAGVAPACRIMVVKCAYDDTPDNIAFGFQGIAYAVDLGARIINCSWGGGNPSSVEQEAINYADAKGVLVVAAAGNNDNSIPLYPAGYNHVLSVTGSTSNDGPDIFYSNFGTTVDVIAPGSNILSTYVGNSYLTLSGTSMAAPCASGIAALVASHFPGLTPDQIAARVRATSDPIDSQLYYKYQKLFGFGRVNAYRAVHDTGVKAVVIDTFYVSNDDNGDGMLEPGETGSIRVRFKNLLSPTAQLTATIVDSLSGGTPDNMRSGVDPYVSVVSPNSYIGAMPTFGLALTQSNTFRVHVAANTPQNYLLWFRVDFTDGSYHDYRYFSLYVNPTYITMNANDVACTFNSRGNDAFNDFPNNSQGVGFTYKGSSNLLFEGALMIATDSAHVENVARDDPAGGQDSDFTMLQRANLATDPDGTQEATALWNDASANPATRLGVQIAMHNYEYVTPGNTNFVIVSYTISNTSGRALNNFYCGIYMDWDIGENGDTNYATYDDAYQLGWIRRMYTNAYPVVGSALLTSQTPSFYAIDNNPNASNPPFAVNSGFTRAEKYTCLASGIGRHNSSIGDVGNTIGGGPVTIPAGGQQTFAFALIAGPNLYSLENSAIAARQLWQSISTNQPARVDIFFPPTNLYGSYDSTIVNAVTNTTGGAAAVTLALAGADASSFAILSPATFNMNANESRDVQVRFAPADTGFKSAALIAQFPSMSDTINLYGDALAIGLRVTPAQLAYDSIAIGSAERKSVSIASARNDTIAVTASISGTDASAFSIAAPQPILVPPGGVTFPVDFIPDHTDSAVATLTVTPAIGLPTTIQLTGVGYIKNGTTITTYPSPLTFDTTLVDSSSSKTFTIYNAGADSVTLAYVITGADSLSFRASGLPQQFTVPPGSTQIPITFTPQHIEWNYAAFTFGPPSGAQISEALRGFSSEKQVGVAQPPVEPRTAALAFNYPNPFSGTTIIAYTGAEPVRSVKVFDMLGRQVTDLTPRLVWNNDAQQAAFDAAGLPEGVYYYKVQLQDRIVTGAMMLVK